MLGRSIDVIVPEPIATIHSQLVQYWISTGNDRLINSGSRYLFGLHRAGHIFPMKVNVRSAGDSFAVCVEEVVTQTHFIMYGGSTTGFRVFAACKASMALLGFDVAGLKQGAVSMKDFAPAGSSPEATLGALDNTEMKNVTLRVPEMASDAAGSGAAAHASRWGEMTIAARQQIIYVKHVPYGIFIMRW